jgi:spore coat polysaccharide biosynthesis predicted glycosyltransferase SpsG
MPIIRHVAVVFRIAAGPRLGFGHLVRCRAIARALGVEPRVSIRGTAATRRAGATLGLRVLAGGTRLLDRERPQVLVVDDPSAAAARPWVQAARRRGIPVATIHDAGLARLDADLVIDGSVGTPAATAPARLFGPRYAILDPRLTARASSRRPRAGRILVAVGGGAHVFARVPAVVAELARRAPGADIQVAAGFTARRRRPVLTSGRWLAPDRFAAALAGAQLALVAGGITAYEACALGVPAVAVSVVAAQRPTVRALARRGAAVDGGSLGRVGADRRVAARLAQLLAAPALQRRLAAAGRRLVDGHGAARVATAIRALAMTGGTRG